MIQHNRLFNQTIPVLLLIIMVTASGCTTLALRTQTGLIVKNKTSNTIIIEELKKIRFTDYTTTPWIREYTHYIDESCSTTIKPGKTLKISIDDGYYGITICDVDICIYRNFHFKKVTIVVVEDIKKTGSTTIRIIN